MGNRIKAYNTAHRGGPIDRHSLNQRMTGFSLDREGHVARWVGEGSDKASRAERRRREAEFGEVIVSPTLELEQIEIAETRGVLLDALKTGELSTENFSDCLPLPGRGVERI